MAHKKEQLIRKVVKNGRGSYYINIPKEIVDHLHLRERQKLVITMNGKKITIQDWPIGTKTKKSKKK